MYNWRRWHSRDDPFAAYIDFQSFQPRDFKIDQSPWTMALKKHCGLIIREVQLEPWPPSQPKPHSGCDTDKRTSLRAVAVSDRVSDRPKSWPSSVILSHLTGQSTVVHLSLESTALEDSLLKSTLELVIRHPQWSDRFHSQSYIPSPIWHQHCPALPCCHTCIKSDKNKRKTIASLRTSHGIVSLPIIYIGPWVNPRAFVKLTKLCQLPLFFINDSLINAVVKHLLKRYTYTTRETKEDMSGTKKS